MRHSPEVPMNAIDNQTNIAATVLVVDDDPGARLLVGSALEIAGFRVTTAADGKSALSEFHAHPADCVVLDVVMPGMSGFDVCRALRAQQSSKHVPILMQTSLDDMESVQTRLQRGRHRFLIQGHQPDAAGGTREIPGAGQADPGSAARKRSASALSGLLRPAHRAAEPAAIAADFGTAGGVGRTQTARHRRVDARRR